MRKILYSPGFGAGWSTWMHNIPTKFVCEYQLIIEAIEKAEKLVKDDVWDIKIEDCHESVQKFIKECEERFNKIPYLGGLKDLCIYEVPEGSLYRITEYDGSESVELNTETDWN